MSAESADTCIVIPVPGVKPIGPYSTIHAVSAPVAVVHPTVAPLAVMFLELILVTGRQGVNSTTLISSIARS